MPTTMDRGDKVKATTSTRKNARAQEARRSPLPAVVHTLFSPFRRLFGPEASQTRVSVPGGEAFEARWPLKIVVTEDELDGGFIAECPELPGCMSQGETEDEALENLSDAIGGVIAARMHAHVDAHDIVELPDSGTPGVRCFAIPVL